MPKDIGYGNTKGGKTQGSMGGNSGPVMVSHFQNGPEKMDSKMMGERPTKSTKDTKRGGVS